MKALTTLFIFILATLGVTSCASTTEAQPVPTKGVEQVVKATPAKPIIKCTEDSPCWDCKTMGNKVCGPAKPASKPAPKVSPKPTHAPASVALPTPTITAASEPTASAPKAAPAKPAAPKAHRITPKPICALSCEAVRFNDYRYIPRDEYTAVEYLGTSSLDSTNGDDIYSVRSKFDPSKWHSYKITFDPKTVGCDKLPLGSAKAGIMLDCYRIEAQEHYNGTAYDFVQNYLGSGASDSAPAGTAYWFASDKYPGVRHYFK